VILNKKKINVSFQSKPLSLIHAFLSFLLQKHVFLSKVFFSIKTYHNIKSKLLKKSWTDNFDMNIFKNIKIINLKKLYKNWP